MPTGSTRGWGRPTPDGKTIWFDCKLLTVEGKGWETTESSWDRLPAKAKDTAPAAVWNLSHDTTGMCVRFTTDAPSARERHKPVVFYGTSITQGGCASRPGMAAAAIVGRALDVKVINLGFSGNGRMEPEMADLLAELDPSVYVLDFIPNMTPGMVRERFEPFVRKLRGARPDTPILLAEDHSVRNVTPTEKGRIARAVYEKLTKEGMKNLSFLSNKGMLGDDFEGTVDGAHPNDLGMMRQATIHQGVGPPRAINRIGTVRGISAGS